MTSQEFLKSIGACPSGTEAVGSRSLKVAVENSVRPDWLYWLAAWNAGQRGWPERRDVVNSLGVCVVKIPPDNQHVYKHLELADRSGTREDFVRLVRKAVESFPRDRWAEMCMIFRATLDVPFLETLDK